MLIFTDQALQSFLLNLTAENIWLLQETVAEHVSRTAPHPLNRRVIFKETHLVLERRFNNIPEILNLLETTHPNLGISFSSWIS